MSHSVLGKVNLNIDKHSINFLYPDKQRISLNIGYQTVIERHFKHSLPTAYEIEMAIISIEDAIETIYKQWQPVESVSTNNQQVKVIAKLVSDKNYFDSITLENMFNRVADVIAGSPKQEDEFPDSLEFMATLLIIRELVHHLAIERIEIK